MAIQEKRLYCTFCEKDFKRKSWFDKHMCDKKRRFLARNNISTIQAHRLFNHWQKKLRLLRQGKTKTVEEFCKSPYYNLFIKLAEFTDKNHVVSSYQYLDWLIDQEIPEKGWCDPRDLSKYHRHVRAIEDPEVQVSTTIKSIETWCKDNDVDVPAEFFKRVTPGQALNMVRDNRLSPWVLFGYERSLNELMSRFDGTEALFALHDHINVTYWANKVQRDKDECEMVQSLCTEYFNHESDSERPA